MALFREARFDDEVAITRPRATGRPSSRLGRADNSYFEFKNRIHRQLIERLDLAKLDVLPAETSSSRSAASSRTC